MMNLINVSCQYSFENCVSCWCIIAQHHTTGNNFVGLSISIIAFTMFSLIYLIALYCCSINNQKFDVRSVGCHFAVVSPATRFQNPFQRVFILCLIFSYLPLKFAPGFLIQLKRTFKRIQSSNPETIWVDIMYFVLMRLILDRS